METLTFKTITDESLWNSHLQTRPEANFLQSWGWGDFYRRLGQPTDHIGYYAGSRLVGVMLGIVEQAKRATYLTVAGGPLLDWKDQKLILAWLNSLKTIASGHGCVFVRVRPQIIASPESEKLFTELGFRRAPMHLHAELTNQLDITRTQTEMLSGMRKSTRYELKQADRLGIKVLTSSDPDDIEGFYQLQLDTAKRQGFVPFTLKYLKSQFAVFASSGNALLFSSYFENTLLAQAFIIFYGREAVYHYGASTEAGRKYPGAYATQWAAIMEAKNRGMKRYNFWGVAPPDQPDHRFAPLSTFKRGFGGKDIAYLPAHDLVIDPVKYSLNCLVENVRKKTRRL